MATVYGHNKREVLSIDLSEVKIALKNFWVEKDTAILVFHGIGNQPPLETIDLFARGLLKTLKELTNAEYTLRHGVRKRGNLLENAGWIENYIRICKAGSDHSIDIYEYYWAHLPSGKASASDIQKWVSHTIKGARKFYKENERLGKMYRDNSLFFTKTGEFRHLRYRFFLEITAKFIPFLYFIASFTIKVLSQIPFVGPLFASLLINLQKSGMGVIDEVIGDIVVYNSSDQKSKFYKVRKAIRDGGFQALKELLQTDDLPPYEKVIVAGHSLGSEIAFDVFNRLSHLISLGEINGYDREGRLNAHPQTSISDVLSGFVTFGCPLDKIAFFFRDQVAGDAFVRRQLLRNYYCFKQRNWAEANGVNDSEIESPFSRPLENIQWRNYFDRHDYVSGALDYYEGLTNVDCHFRPRNLFSFTHGYYWDYLPLYADLIRHFLK